MKNGVKNMTKKQINMEQSPFYKKRNMIAPRGSTNMQAQVSEDVEHDLMTFIRQYNKEHDISKTSQGKENKSRALQHLFVEFLNNHALDKQCFENLHVIMLFSNPFDYKKRHCEVIGFVDHEDKFKKFEVFRGDAHNNEYKFIYAFEHFDKEWFDLLGLENLNKTALFNIDKEFQHDFDHVEKRLKELYEDIDFDNAYFVMFNLNNYLDVLRDGVYVSKSSTYEHQGVIVLLDPDDISSIIRLCARITWSFNAGVFTFEFNVEDEGYFNTEIIDKTPEGVYDEYWSIFGGFMSICEKYDMQLKDTNLQILMKEQEIERLKNKRDDLQHKLDECQ